MSTDLELSVKADTKDAIKSILDFKNAAGDVSSAVSGAFGAIKAAAGVALAVFAGKQVVDFFSEGIEAAEAQEQAMARLGQQLQLTGDYSEEALNGFAAFADQMEKTSKYGDDVVLSQVAVAKSFGISNDQAQNLVKAAIELSAATGQSLDGAVQALGKTFSGVTGKLDEQIPVLKGLTKEQLASGAALDVVLERFGGSAQAEINTFSGALLQTGNAFGNLQEAFGAVITGNAAVIAAIKAVGEIFGELQRLVEENKDGMNDLATLAAEGFAVGLGVAVDVTGFLIRALEGLVSVGGLAFGSLVDIAATFARAWQATFGQVYDYLLTFLENVVSVAGKVPILGDALEALGVNTDDAAASIGEFRQAFNETVDAGAKGLEDFRDSTFQATASFVEGAEQFNGYFDAFGEFVDNAAAKVFEADEANVAGAEKVTAARSAMAAASAKDAKEFAKLAEEAKKLEKTITEESLNDLQKIVAKRDEEQRQIVEFYRQGVITAEKAAELRETVEKTAIAKLTAAREEADKKALEEAKKNAEEMRAAVQQAAADPVKLLIDTAEIKPLDLAPGVQKGIAAGAGVLADVMSGKEGAQKLIAEGAGKLADAFMPGLGPVVSQLTNMLERGPEANKQFVKEFVDAVPDLIVAISESIPAVVEALVDSLINEGGIVKIAAALVRAILFEGTFKSIGRQLGIEAGSSFNSANIAQTLAQGMQNGLNPLERIPGLFETGMQKFAEAIGQGLNAYINGLLTFYTVQVPNAVRNAFGFIVNFLDTFEFPMFPGLDLLWSTVEKLTGNPPWLEPFTAVVNQLTNWKIPGTGGGGDGGFVNDKVPVFGKYADGISSIPAGFPNDSFLAGLTSNERVVQADGNRDLTAFLAAQKDGGGFGGGRVEALLEELVGLMAGASKTVEIKLDSRVLGKGILNLNTNNARLTR